MLNRENIETILLNRGFCDYKWIDPKDIVVSNWVRVKCMYGCADYGSGSCPPNTPPVEECVRFFREYSSAVLIRLSKIARKNAYPSDWSREMTGKLLEIERGIFLGGYQKAFLLNHTCCASCTECAGTRQGCKDKANARPSPEGFAVDVYQTIRNAGLDIGVVSEHESEMHRVAILLVE